MDMDFALSTTPPRISQSLCHPMAWEALRLGHQVHPTHVHFENGQYHLLPENSQDELPKAPFVYGHSGLVVAVKQGAMPGWQVDWNPDLYDRGYWIRNHAELMWNDQAQIITLQDALKQWKQGLMHLCPSGADSGPKAFKAVCADRKDLTVLLANAAQGRALDPQMLVSLSHPNLPDSEYRCVFVGGELITAGRYLTRGVIDESRDAPEEVLAFAREAAQSFLPGEYCVMDVGVKGARMKIIEFNALHSSGLYQISREKVIHALDEHWNHTPIRSLQQKPAAWVEKLRSQKVKI